MLIEQRIQTQLLSLSGQTLAMAVPIALNLDLFETHGHSNSPGLKCGHAQRRRLLISAGPRQKADCSLLNFIIVVQQRETIRTWHGLHKVTGNFGRLGKL